MALLFLFTTLAFADAYPVDRFIEEKVPGATNCLYEKGFDNGFTCGEKAGFTYRCEIGEEEVDVLVFGSIGSDAGESCSPTFMPEFALPERAKAKSKR